VPAAAFAAPRYASTVGGVFCAARGVCRRAATAASTVSGYFIGFVRLLESGAENGRIYFPSEDAGQITVFNYILPLVKAYTPRRRTK
jgi:phytoene/squalene synthetase